MKHESNGLEETLRQRTAELAKANALLQKCILGRKGVEHASKKSGQHYAKLLKDSLQLQKSLRQLTHRALSAQEDERKKISVQLQDEIAQTLLGINVRLLTLKEQAKGNTKGLRNEIASTQRLVIKSTKFMRLAARKMTMA
jgi:signal transduction histidine kinase